MISTHVAFAIFLWMAASPELRMWAIAVQCASLWTIIGVVFLAHAVRARRFEISHAIMLGALCSALIFAFFNPSSAAAATAFAYSVFHIFLNVDARIFIANRPAFFAAFAIHLITLFAMRRRGWADPIATPVEQ